MKHKWRIHVYGMDWKKHTDNRYFVYEGDTLKAAQSTKTGALKFMKPGRVLRKSPKN